MKGKKAFIVFILLFTFAYAKSQDKIVTIQGDTIFCKIVSVSLEFIKYEKKDYNRTTGNYSIPTKQVREYSLGPRTKESDTNSVDSVSIENPHPVLEKNTPTEEKPFSPPVKKKQVADPFSPASYRKPKTETFSRWRIGIQGGGSYLINSLPHLRQAMKDLGVYPTKQADDYYNKLRLGLSAGADVYYMINPSFGVGVKGSGFYSTVQKNYTAGGGEAGDPFAYTVNEVSEREKLYLYYAGPSVLFQQWLSENHKFRLNEELSVGYIFFRDMAQFDPNLHTFVNPDTGVNLNSVSKTGNSFSGTLQLSLEYYPVSHVSIGLSAGVVPAIFRSLSVSNNGTSIGTETLGKSHSLDLTRADASLSVRFRF